MSENVYQAKKNAKAAGSQAVSPGASMAPPTFQLKASGATTQQKSKKFVAPDGYKGKKENSWKKDVSAESGAPLSYDSEADAKHRETYLKKVGEWEDIEVVEEKVGGKTKYHIKMRGKRTINNYIKLIKKVEAAYPGKSTDEIIDALRGTAKYYNNNNWKDMLGKKAKAKPIKPVKNMLTQGDLDALTAMFRHSGGHENTEKGIVKDNGGDYMAIGHVLTGITAGINRDKETDLRKSGMAYYGSFVGAGEKLDNMAASTISGDLGQSAAIKNAKGATKNTRFIGPGTEASNAEMIGDIDGYNMGAALSVKKKSPAKLSELLIKYYSSVENNEKKNRFETFKKNVGSTLKSEVERFATNYAYTNAASGKYFGLVARPGAEADWAVEQFDEWLKNQIKTSSDKPLPKDKAGNGNISISGDTALMVSDPSNYSKTKMASLKNGSLVRIVDRGEGKPFNATVTDKAKYGWSKVMMKDGQNEGKIGWVSNSYLNEKKK